MAKREAVYNAMMVGCALTESEVSKLNELCAPQSLHDVIQAFCKSLLSGDLKISHKERSAE